MGIRDFLFAINKMDMVGYDRQRCREIENTIHGMTDTFTLNSLAIIPVSATAGDNITEHSDKMPWYNGPSLLEYLDQVEVRSDPSDTDFTMPVQRVCRPDSSFRVSGTDRKRKYKSRRRDQKPAKRRIRHSYRHSHRL